jgi:nicotinamide riboside kinase
MKLLITGTFCSGKTTLAKALHQQISHSILLEEPARELITNLPNLDWSKKYIREYLIVRQILIEKEAQSKSDVIIVDAGIESNIAHDMLFHSDFSRNEYLKELDHQNYDFVFFCQHEEINFISDGYRMQDLQLRDKLSTAILEVLEILEYTPVLISGNITNRANQVMKQINSSLK